MAENGIRIKSRRGRGGVVKDVRFDNWTMENVEMAIFLAAKPDDGDSIHLVRNVLNDAKFPG